MSVVPSSRYKPVRLFVESFRTTSPVFGVVMFVLTVPLIPTAAGTGRKQMHQAGRRAVGGRLSAQELL